MVSLVRPCVSFSLSLVAFLCRFDSESDSDSSGSIWSRGISTPFATHQIQAVSLLHSCHVDSCRTYLFAILVRQRARWIPERNWCVTKWKKAFKESSSRTSLLLAYIILFTYIPVLLLAIFYSNIFIKLKTQAHPGEQSTNNQQQWNTRNSPLLSLQCLCSAGYLTLSTF